MTIQTQDKREHMNTLYALGWDRLFKNKTVIKKVNWSGHFRCV